MILDADLLIANERGVFDLESWLIAQPRGRFELAAITVAELWHGLERATGKYKARRQAYIETVLATFPVIPYTDLTARIHARLWATLESSGKMIGYHDLIVAATAIERGSAVASFNLRHFSAIKGLKVIQPK